MSKSTMKIVGIACLVVTVICIFVAVERYQANARNVRAMSQFQRSSPLGGMMGTMGLDMKPATPGATKYAIFFAVLSGVAGVAFLIVGAQPAKSVPSGASGQDSTGGHVPREP